MNRTIMLVAAAILLVIGAYVFLIRDAGKQTHPAMLTDPAEGAPMVEVDLPDAFSPKAELGKTTYDTICTDCHGQNATGRMGMGPPLVHKIYEPAHHGDMSFHMAAQNGVRAHHWRFGDMPPQSGLTRADVDAIIAYVRELQRANGIN